MKSPLLRLCVLPLGLAVAALAGGCSMGFPLVPPMHPLMLLENAPALESPILPEAPRTVSLPGKADLGPLDAAAVTDPLLLQLVASPIADDLVFHAAEWASPREASAQTVSLQFDWGTDLD